ncbi:Uncharacterised protein [Mycobacteroides abscessus subsp. abscessus]|uniref:hypothetical protein n=1 Tax=Mycobacteriaceae TaxID=1762 RepID=UPI0006B3BDB3|nr:MULTISPECIES: hypothetical protein [Mycobacteriaceae]KAB7757448.1 hypothetical protein MMUC44124_15095 [Mycolicibacterium mucogenicum DSM 44124]SLE90753.1 Uncharacterised protein [Mycobacteroides abscessus subsp. abscessus]
MSTRDRGGGEPQLWVDEQVHATECRRFDASIAYGPTDADCDIWIKAIGGDGYGRFYITRNGRGRCVRPHRYALARARRHPLAADVFGLHGCNNPLCVKVREDRQHVYEGDQRENMIWMARSQRGSSGSTLRRDRLADRRARSVALREAARNGWDRAAINDVLQQGQELGLFDVNDTLRHT